MKPSLSEILPLLNANCGDVLKAALLNQFFPELPKINPLYLKVPTGDIESAFSAIKAAKPESDRATQLLADFRSDHALIAETREPRAVDPIVQKLTQQHSTAKTLSAMPNEVRFEDAAPADISAPIKGSPPEPEFITIEEAAAKFGWSYVGLSTKLKNAGVEGVRRPGHGRAKFFDMNKMVEVCASKGKHSK